MLLSISKKNKILKKHHFQTLKNQNKKYLNIMINKINLEPKNEFEVKESIYEILNLLSQEQLTNLNWLLSKEIEKININNNNNNS